MRSQSHRLFLALTATCLASGCARELELPAPPAPAQVEEPRPRLLGERAGLYQAWTQTKNEYDLEEWVSVGPRLPILHVENPADEPVDLLVVQLQPLLLNVELERPAGFVEESCESAGDALDGPMLAFGFYEPVSGTVELQLDEESGIAASGGTLAAGGLSLQVPFCGDDRLFPVVLRPVCPLQPALSGVYAGEWDDGGAARTTDVALGISGRNLLLVEWPQGGLAALGSSGLFGLGLFDPNTEGGLFFGFRAGAPEASLSAVCGGIALRRTVDEVALALRTYAGANPDSFDCPAFTEEAPEPIGGFDGTRLAGAGDAACSADEGALPLVATARLRRCAGREVLDLRVTREGTLLALDADLPQLAGALPRGVEEILEDGLFVRAEATSGETELRRLDASRAWPPVTARFELPAGRSRILVRAFVRDLASGSAGSILPLCPVIGR